PLAYSQPDAARTALVGERSEAAHGQREGAHTSDGPGAGLCRPLFLLSSHVAEEAQREMQTLGTRWAQDGAVGSEQIRQPCQPFLQDGWQHNGDEKAPCGAR